MKVCKKKVHKMTIWGSLLIKKVWTEHLPLHNLYELTTLKWCRTAVRREILGRNKNKRNKHRYKVFFSVWMYSELVLPGVYLTVYQYTSMNGIPVLTIYRWKPYICVMDVMCKMYGKTKTTIGKEDQGRFLWLCFFSWRNCPRNFMKLKQTSMR